MTDQTQPENSIVKDWLKKANDDELNIQSSASGRKIFKGIFVIPKK